MLVEARDNERDWRTVEYLELPAPAALSCPHPAGSVTKEPR